MESCCKVEHNKERFYEKRIYHVLSLIISFVALLFSFFWGDIIGSITILTYFNPGWIAVVLCGIPIVTAAFENLFIHKKIKSSLLITTALMACIALEVLCWAGITATDGHSHSESYLFAAGEVVFLMAIGELLEDITVKKSRAGIEKLLNLAPTTATVDVNGQFMELPVALVQVGDKVLIKPNEQISVDGTVISGRSAVNTSAITGESLPVDVETGDAVYAGTWNGDGAITVTVTKMADDTTVAKMIKLVKQAESKKAPIASTADKWASVIVPMAIAFSVVVFLLVWFAFSLGWQEALVRGVTVLVVFCPCALALATPTAIAAAIGNASKHGILIKSGLALETLANVKSFVFDKTGTLTESKIELKQYATSMDDNEFLSIIASVESASEHPLAKAITAYAEGKVQLAEVGQIKSITGVGIEATYNDKAIMVAKYSYFQDAPFATEVAAYLSNGYTVVAMAIDGSVVGVVALADTVRSLSAQSISQLNAMNLNTIMLTGDNASSAAAVANELGISSFTANLMPQQKVDEVEALKQVGKVCMVGDGVNDAPALAAADCSVTMGVMGSDAALEIADIALMNDRIELLPTLKRLSVKTLNTIRRNIVISMCINIASVVLSMLGLLTPVLGALVHNCSSVFVVFSSSLLLAYKDKKR